MVFFFILFFQNSHNFMYYFYIWTWKQLNFKNFTKKRCATFILCTCLAPFLSTSLLQAISFPWHTLPAPLCLATPSRSFNLLGSLFLHGSYWYHPSHRVASFWAPAPPRHPHHAWSLVVLLSMCHLHAQSMPQTKYPQNLSSLMIPLCNQDWGPPVKSHLLYIKQLFVPDFLG